MYIQLFYIKKKNNFYLIISLHMSRIIVFDFYNITT